MSVSLIHHQAVLFSLLTNTNVKECLFLREHVKLQREVMSAETALEQKRMARHNLLLACKVQSLPITLLSGSLDEVSEVQVRRRSFSHIGEEERDGSKTFTKTISLS